LTHTTGSLTISKTVNTGGSGFTSGTFGVHVDCGTAGTFDKTITYPTSGSVTITGIPTGSSCTVTETTMPTPPTGYSWGTPVISGSPASISTKGQTVTVNVKNTLTRDTGSLAITKTLVGAPQGFNPTFTIHYDCGNGLSGNVSV